MNWTGGRLQRHSKNATKGVIVRQKQYFARRRTQLQNGVTTSTQQPFRPEYQHYGVIHDVHRPPPESGAPQHARLPEAFWGEADPTTPHPHPHPHDPAKRRRSSRRRVAPDNPTDGEAASVPFRELPGAPLSNQSLVCDTHPGPRDTAPKQRSTAIPGEINARGAASAWENQKQRLLNRPDWAGLAPLRPVSMQFPSRGDKDRIGKRRRVDKHAVRGGYDDVARQTSNKPAMRLRPPFHNNTSREEALHLRDIEDISVRIGTEALTSHTAVGHGTGTQPLVAQGSGRGESPLAGSSDLMLFDHPAAGQSQEQTPSTSANYFPAGLGPVAPELQQFKIPNRRPPTPPWQSTDCMQFERLVDGEHPPNVCVAHDTAFDNGYQGVSVGEGEEAPAAVQIERDDSHGSNFHITQHLGDPSHPYRFVSGSPDCSSVKGAMHASQGIGKGENHKSNTTSSACVPGNHGSRCVASDLVTGKVQGQGTGIDDDGPWRAFLAISGGDSSSHSTTSWRRPGLSRQRELDDLGVRNQFSPKLQLATPDARASTNSVLDFMPSDGLSNRNCSPSGLLHNQNNLDARAGSTRGDKVIQSEEELWRAFVFGDDHKNSPAFHAAHNNCREQGEGHPASTVQRHSRLMLASSLAVKGSSSTNSILTTSSKSVYPQFPCVSDDVQNAGGRIEEPIPLSAKAMRNGMSPWMKSGEGFNSSPIALSEHSGGRSEQESVTHASLENNASTSEGLDLQHNKAERKQRRPRLLKRGETLRRAPSSVKGILDSDEMDLIDPYKAIR